MKTAKFIVTVSVLAIALSVLAGFSFAEEKTPPGVSQQEGVPGRGLHKGWLQGKHKGSASGAHHIRLKFSYGCPKSSSHHCQNLEDIPQNS